MIWYRYKSTADELWKSFLNKLNLEIYFYSLLMICVWVKNWVWKSITSCLLYLNINYINECLGHNNVETNFSKLSFKNANHFINKTSKCFNFLFLSLLPSWTIFLSFRTNFLFYFSLFGLFEHLPILQHRIQKIWFSLKFIPQSNPSEEWAYHCKNRKKRQINYLPTKFTQYYAFWILFAIQFVSYLISIPK